MNSAYLLAAVIAVIGLWFVARGVKLKSKPRMLAGVAILFFAAAQLFEKHSTIGTTLLAIGLALIVTAAYVFRIEGARIIRQPQRPRRR